VAALTALVVGGGAGLGAPAIRDAVVQPTEPSTPTPEPQLGSEAAAVAAKVLPSTVMIMVTASRGNSSGSGFVLDGEGRILTNNHVIEPADGGAGTVTVLFNDGTRTEAEIVGRSPSYDVGLIKVDPASVNLVPVELGDSDAVQVGDVAIALGSPLGLAQTVTEGIISARNRPVASGDSADDASFMNALQTDAAINPGNSGGPLTNAAGKVIGINSAILSNTTGDQRPGNIGIGFAIPINQAKTIGDQIVQTGHATYPTAGVTVSTAGNKEGARITEVESGGPAASAGLEVGDVVVKVGDRTVMTMVEFFVAIRSHRPNDEVAVTYNRSGTPEETKVTLAEQQG